jgi:hypothetical protein
MLHALNPRPQRRRLRTPDRVSLPGLAVF